MKEVTIAAEPREGVGKGVARKARSAGRIPAVVYGPELENPEPITIGLRDLRAAVKEAGGTNAIFSVRVNGKDTKTILREIQRHPVRGDVLHIDLHAISMTKPLNISVPINYVGTPRGVKEGGGVFQIIRRELEISCLPKEIPNEIKVDVAELIIGDSIHVSDIKLESGTKVTDDRLTMALVSAPTVLKTAEEEAAEGEEAEAAAEGAEGAEAAPDAEGGDDAKSE